MNEWVAVLAFAGVSGAAGLAGVWLMLRHETWARRHSGELITFASGVLISGSLLHILTEAAEMAGGQATAGWALAAFVVMYIAENHFLPHPHARTDEEGALAGHSHDHHGHGMAVEGFGAAAVAGLALHALLDGIAVGAGFSTSLVAGGVIVSLVIAHKLPVGIATMSVLYHGGEDRRRAARYSAGVALLTPAAVILSYLLLRGVGNAVLGPIVAAAGGSFLYVGAADLLPEGKASGLGRNTFAFLSGIIVMLAALALPH